LGVLQDFTGVLQESSGFYRSPSGVLRILQESFRSDKDLRKDFYKLLEESQGVLLKESFRTFTRLSVFKPALTYLFK